MQRIPAVVASARRVGTGREQQRDGGGVTVDHRVDECRPGAAAESRVRVRPHREQAPHLRGVSARGRGEQQPVEHLRTGNLEAGVEGREVGEEGASVRLQEPADA